MPLRRIAAAARFHPELLEQLGVAVVRAIAGSLLIDCMGSGGAPCRGTRRSQGREREHRAALLRPATAERRAVERQSAVAALVVGEPTQDTGLDWTAPPHCAISAV